MNDAPSTSKGPMTRSKKRRLDKDANKDKVKVAKVVEEKEEDDVCAVCLDSPRHPVTLDCGHVFCFLCVKGLIEKRDENCSVCRRRIPVGFLKRRNVLKRSKSDLAASTKQTETSSGHEWFYEGRGGGWWRFEGRNNEDIEDAFERDPDVDYETLICGHIYVIDFVNMVQYRKGVNGVAVDGPRRRIKRDKVDPRECKGVAGLVQDD